MERERYEKLSTRKRGRWSSKTNCEMREKVKWEKYRKQDISKKWLR